MAVFRTFEEFEVYFSDLMNFFQPGDPSGLEGEMSPQDILAGSSVKLGSSFKDFMGEVKVRECLRWRDVFYVLCVDLFFLSFLFILYLDSSLFLL